MTEKKSSLQKKLAKLREETGKQNVTGLVCWNCRKPDLVPLKGDKWIVQCEHCRAAGIVVSDKDRKPRRS